MKHRKHQDKLDQELLRIIEKDKEHETNLQIDSTIKGYDFQENHKFISNTFDK